MDRAITGRAEDFARARMKAYDPGHDWLHTERVRKTAAYINSVEKAADPFILDIAAILHDAADSKFNPSGSYSEVEKVLDECGLQAYSLRIIDAIKNISFSNKQPSGDLDDPLFMILQDADRLDAIGAIGIARAFSYGGYRGNTVYSPSGEDGGEEGTTIRHFYDKLLKLKDLMNTTTGRELAESRHRFLEEFLQQFYREWELSSSSPFLL